MWINRILNIRKLFFWYREVIISFGGKIKQLPRLRKAKRYFGRDDSEAQQCHPESTFSPACPEFIEGSDRRESNGGMKWSQESQLPQKIENPLAQRIKKPPRNFKNLGGLKTEVIVVLTFRVLRV